MKSDLDSKNKYSRPVVGALLALALSAGGAAAAVPASAASGASVTVEVPAMASASTGVQLAAGDVFHVSATGIGSFWWGASLETSTCQNTGYTRPDGSRVAAGVAVCPPYFGGSAGAFLVPTSPAGTLVGRIGDGSWFAVGAEFTGTAATSGALVLAYNDLNRVDNNGSYTAVISVTPGSTTPGPITPEPTVVEVPLDAERVSTGVTLAAGDPFEIAGSGTGAYGWEGANCPGKPTVDPTGARMLPAGACAPKLDGFAPIPSAPIGSLIARIGDGPWFLVGGHLTGVADRSGELELRINDSILSDNEGAYTATVTPRG